MDELDIVRHYIGDSDKPGLMLDVGAREGESSLPFLKSGWRVYAFEPDPDNCRKARSRLQGFQEAHIDPRAVADEDGSYRTLYASPISSGISSLHPFHETHQEHCNVETVTLSSFCRQNHISAVDLLKVDVEGLELAVFRGHDWQLRPRIVLCEFETSKTAELGYGFKDLAAFLHERGYHLLVSEWYPIVRYGSEHTWRCFHRWPCELADPNSWGNIIAFADAPDYFRLLNAASSVFTSQKTAHTILDNDSVLTAFIRARWQLLAAKGIHRVFLFGAGRHTPWLLDCIREHPNPEVMAILDDNIQGREQLDSIPVRSPLDVDPADVDAIIMSTDVHQDAMQARCRKLWGEQVTCIDLYEEFEGDVPLARKTHESRAGRPVDKNAIVIYQMGKVGSTTIRQSVARAGFQCYHTHYLCESKLSEIEQLYARRGQPAPPYVATSRKLIRVRFFENNPCSIITLVREPVARNISAFFQNHQRFHIYSNRAGDDDIDALIVRFLNEYSHRVPLIWFDIEMKACLGVDVYQYPFPHDKGSLIIEQDNFRILVLKIETSNNVQQQALSQFLGLPSIQMHRENTADNKSYAKLYTRFLDRVNLSDTYLDRMYNSKYARHFYSHTEIARFRARWKHHPKTGET